MASGNDEGTSGFSPSERLEMLDIAEDVIARAVASGGEEPARNAAKNSRLEKMRRGTFVTLHVEEMLHGCIGSLKPCRVLADDIASNAYRAAFYDPRFPATCQRDLDGLQVHISVLGELQPMAVRDEDDLVSQLEVGRDGLLLVAGRRRGTFLPSVWEKMDSASTFVRLLKRKAGIPADAWPAGLECYRYHVVEFDRAELTD